MSNLVKPTVQAHPTTGAVITASVRNPEWGTFRVDSIQPTFSGGVLNMSKRTAFVRGRVVDLEAYGIAAGMQLDGKIIRRESHAPLYDGQTPKIYPNDTVIGGVNVSGQPVLKNGREVYMESVYTEALGATDEWVGDTPDAIAEDVAQALSQQEVN